MGGWVVAARGRRKVGELFRVRGVRLGGEFRVRIFGGADAYLKSEASSDQGFDLTSSCSSFPISNKTSTICSLHWRRSVMVAIKKSSHRSTRLIYNMLSHGLIGKPNKLFGKRHSLPV